MAQLGEQLAMVLRSGRAVMRMTPKRASQEQASGADELASPNAPMSPALEEAGRRPRSRAGQLRLISWTSRRRGRGGRNRRG